MVEVLEQRYKGSVQPELPKEDEDGQLLYPYIPTEELKEVVNLAIRLQRPLLLKGEPGSGKTKLARAVAYELKLPYKEWNIKSTTRAKDGLYTYDAVGRLRDAQLAAVSSITEEERKKINERINNPISYVKYGPLGKAFLNNNWTVLLIDEIDKADIDFPNDLLLELDELRFDIEEIEEDHSQKKIRVQRPPVVFITSNDEKDLPDAFLRRCLFYYIRFPKPDELIQIIKAHFSKLPEELLPEKLLDEIIDRFLELRQEMRNDKGETGKIVSTSELLDWIKALTDEKNLNDLVVSRLGQELLYPGVLLKNWDDYRVYTKRMRSKGDS